jgi:hypothetical protein
MVSANWESVYVKWVVLTLLNSFVGISIKKFLALFNGLNKQPVYHLLGDHLFAVKVQVEKQLFVDPLIKVELCGIKVN